MTSNTHTRLIDFMIWIAPSEKDTDNDALMKRLWDAADQFGANSGLKSEVGLPRTDNANYLWIQLFHSALNEMGRALRLMTTWLDR